MPTTRKNTVINPSFIQKWSERENVKEPIPMDSGACHRAS